MVFAGEDDLAQAAHLSDLAPEQTRLVLAVGFFAENRLTLAQAAALAGLDRFSFQSHLAAGGIPLHYGQKGFDMDLAELDKRWRALRGSDYLVGDPFAAVVTQGENVVSPKAETETGR